MSWSTQRSWFVKPLSKQLLGLGNVKKIVNAPAGNVTGAALLQKPFMWLVGQPADLFIPLG